jgi:anti-sigma factor ChrR (cupin superfamily)
MEPEPHSSTVLCHIADGTPHQVWDVFGPTVEFLTSPDDPDPAFCVMRGVVRPAVVVPLHSHAALLRHLTDILAVEQGLGEINYIGGGEAAMTAKDA